LIINKTGAALDIVYGIIKKACDQGKGHIECNLLEDCPLKGCHFSVKIKSVVEKDLLEHGYIVRTVPASGGWKIDIIWDKVDI
jgi:hypothetical protein